MTNITNIAEQKTNAMIHENAPNSSRTDIVEVLKDYVYGLFDYRIWLYMAYADLRRRYRRTLLGPFWTTLNLSIFIASMGVLFSVLWKTKVSSFLPYFASGFVCWTFISTIITDSCATFTASEGLIKQVAFRYSVFAWSVLARNFMVFLHQVIIFIVIAVIFHVSFDRDTFLLIPGFIILFFTSSWVALLLGLFCARFRDVQQVVVSILQISMFVTPIFWPEQQLGVGFKAYLVVNMNPLYHFVSIVRQPMMGLAPSDLSWIASISITVLGWMLTMVILAKHHRKLIFWL